MDADLVKRLRDAMTILGPVSKGVLFSYRGTELLTADITTACDRIQSLDLRVAELELAQDPVLVADLDGVTDLLMDGHIKTGENFTDCVARVLAELTRLKQERDQAIADLREVEQAWASASAAGLALPQTRFPGSN